MIIKKQVVRPEIEDPWDEDDYMTVDIDTIDVLEALEAAMEKQGDFAEVSKETIYNAIQCVKKLERVYKTMIREMEE